jgi:hypothetical protein
MAAAWESSESTANIGASMVAALSAIGEVAKTRKATIEGRQGGRGYEYEYANLADVLADARPKLAEHGLVVFQTVTTNDRDVEVWTTVMHTSGEWLRMGPLALPAGNTPQQAGSAITYARRYAIMAALGCATEDDDGASAGERQHATSGGARQSSTRRPQNRPESTQPDEGAVPAPRTRYEAQARRAIASVTGDRSTALREAFRARFGTNLVGLPDERHEDALAFVQQWIVGHVQATLGEPPERLGPTDDQRAAIDDEVAAARAMLQDHGIDAVEQAIDNDAVNDQAIDAAYGQYGD